MINKASALHILNILSLSLLLIFLTSLAQANALPDTSNTSKNEPNASAAAKSHQPQYIVLNINVRSNDPAITDAQCRSIFAESYEYDIENDKTIYRNLNKNFKNLNYQELAVTFLDKTHMLFNGVATIQFAFNGKNHQAKDYRTFVLDQNQQQIKGSFIIPGYCKGNLIGLDTSNNIWPPH